MNNKIILYGIIAVLLAILFFRGCDNDEDDEIIIHIPEESGKFKPQEPIYITNSDTVYITKWKTIEIKTQNPVNDSLAIAYQKTKDSLDRYKLYLDAIQLRDFENIFEDEKIKITSTGQVQGKLNWINNSYTIKSRKINVDVPQTFFRLLAGAEIGNNLMFSDFRYKVGIGLQNSKGSIYRLGYGNENLQDYFYLGYDIQIFDWKR